MVAGTVLCLAQKRCLGTMPPTMTGAHWCQTSTCLNEHLSRPTSAPRFRFRRMGKAVGPEIGQVNDALLSSLDLRNPIETRLELQL
jgi:hypothetical protein